MQSAGDIPTTHVMLSTPVHRFVPVEGSAEIVTAQGVRGIRARGVISPANSLPAEFFGRELLEVNAADEGELFGFVSEWGFPYCPFIPAYGVDSGNLLTPRATQAHEGKQWLEGVRETDILCAEFVREDMVISTREASETIERLQEEVAYYYELLEVSILGDVTIEAGRMPCALNAGRAHADALTAWGSTSNPLGARGIVPLTLTNAVCNQFAETAKADAPWKRCQCEGCGRLFKTTRPCASRQKKMTGDRANRISPSDSKYCCDACRVRQSRKNTALTRQTRGK